MGIPEDQQVEREWTDPEDQKVRCPSCKREIGELVVIEGMPTLAVGPVFVRALHGTCKCGQQFHWSLSDRLLEKLVKSVLAMRNG